jgi:tetratricopeptide (TPR) repeat protein
MKQFAYILYVVSLTDQGDTGSLKEALAWRGSIGGHGEGIVRLLHPRTMFNNNNVSIVLLCWPSEGLERLRGTFSAALIFVFLFTHTSEGMAAVPCEPPVGEAVSVQGLVEFNRVGQLTWETVTQGEPFCAGDSVRTASRSRAAILLANQTLIRLDEDTSVTFTEIEPAEPSWLDLLKGSIHFLSRTRRSLKVKTPFVNAAIEGTEFVVRVTPRESGLWVYEGVVVFENAQGSLTLRSGEAAVAVAGKTPARRIVIDPLEAVQWALYYPPVIDYRAAAQATGSDRPAIEAALATYRHNDLDMAFARLDAVPEARRSSTYYTLRAGLLLSVGRVDQAQPDIDRALGLDPANGTAYALRSIIALVRNETDKALSLAEQGARLAPKSSVPQIALSYAYQAQFDIQQARDNASQAVNLSPADSLAWARLSELELSLGQLDKALAAARQAAFLDPDIARTQTILGFANLTEIDIDEAKDAFQKAIALDQAAPLPRLGLGLATIRAGDLDEGVRELEIAASLDPKNSLIRSYLGKGYYDQKREKLAATEFEMAKGLDPKDPTPYFYDAILKQTTNRPVEALRDLQKSIELNDNRAVYRSRLLLDQDLAARSAALGRIYNDLGFQQLGLLEGWKSVNSDPSNYSAHRLLADNYSVLPRHEIARVSELLQSQLLQPINITPVQPALAESNLLILEGEGPSDPSFNEFNPLFIRNRLALQASGVLGNNDAFGDEISQSGVWNNFSYSLGQFHFETDGFRKNNDLERDIYNAFAQVAVTPKLNFQVEYRRLATEQGDLRLNFDPDNFSQVDRRNTDQDTARLGLRFVPSPNSRVIVSFLHTDLETDQEQVRNNVDIKEQNKEKGYQVEAQYLFQSDPLNITAGFGTYQTEVDRRNVLDLTTEINLLGIPCPLFGSPDPCIDIEKLDFNRKQYNSYAYANVVFPKNTTWTIGFSYNSFDERALDQNKLNPKFGLQWNVTDDIKLRFAGFKTIKRALVVNQTIEPTQIAGFNQFFDDFNGTEAKRYGVALDARLVDGLYGGIEASRRDLSLPLFGKEKVTFEDIRENLYRTYFYWTPHSNWVMSAEYRYETFERSLEQVPERPKDIETISIPLAANYFSSSGVLVKFGATYVHQDVEQILTSIADHDNFMVLDTIVGYRFSKRSGIISLEARNVLNEKFRFQDQNIQSSIPTNPIFVPDRTAIIRVTLNF